MKKLLLLMIILPFLVLGQSPDQNYVKTTVYKKPSTVVSIDPTNPAETMVQVGYFDGLGRTVQQIAYKQSATGKDIITHVEYDGFGRQVKDYLPYTKWFGTPSLNYLSPESVQAATMAYYSTYDSSVTGDPNFDQTTNPYSEKLFEASPLNRVLKQAAPGNNWAMGQGHEVKFDYQTNELNEVRLFRVSTSWNAAHSCYNTTFVNNNNYYDKHQLYKIVTKNENWTSGKNNTTEEFKDKEGRVVLKRTFADLVVGTKFTSQVKHDTYYVYDDYGNLTYVLPPLADGIITNIALEGLCYQYKYDHRNRLVEKKLPGKQWEFIVYNNQDMPVATGPAKSPWGEDVWGWMVTKYDIFGRVAYTGWMQNSAPLSSYERISFQNNLNVTWFEAFKTTHSTIDGVNVNYSNDFYPQNIKLLMVNYYDTYNHTFQPIVPSAIEGEPLGNVKSLPTTNWVRVLTTPGEINAEIAHSFYDNKGRLIGTEKFNYLGGFIKSHNKLDFLGKPLYTFTYHKRLANDAVITIKDSYEYTPQERLLSHVQKINNNTEELIAKNEYDELGQLINKEVGGDDVANLVGLQKVHYRYNIRGWLKEINNIDDLQFETDPLDLFAFKINYDEVKDENGYQGTNLFNGNISETYWRTSSDNVLRKYGYHYDYLNRLKNAVYQKPNASWPVTHMYDETLTYDKNGNIVSLKRNGDFDYDYSSTSAFQIDDLKYTYDPQKKNQLMKVTDQVPFTVGFKDGTNTGDDYSYDNNGNMTKDSNKDITLIKYNHLNLPVEIIFGTGNKIEYLYNAVGQKVRKTVTKNAVGTVTDYLDGFQYTDAKLSFFPHAEGYVKVTLCEECQQQYQVRFNYVYNYTDHLGNIRLSYGIDPKDETLKIMEENHYYPFGLKHTNYNGSKLILVKDEEEIMHLKLKQLPGGEQVEYKYKYNGKEYQDEMGLNLYDYGFRNYDPAIGRWMNIDPLGEIYHTDSPYAYVLNNPLSYIDPDGRRLLGVTKDDAKNIHDDINNAFADSKFDKVRALFTRGEKNNKKSFDKINGDVLKDALSGLSGDDLALAELVTSAVNSSVEYKVEYVEDGKEISSDGQTAMNSYWSNLYTNLGHRAPDARTITTTDIIGAGSEGFTAPTANGSHAFIVNNKNTQHGEGRRELTSFHEIFGHGVAIGKKVPDYQNAANAIRTENLVRRVLKIQSQRDGSDHAGGKVNNPQGQPIIKN